MNVVISALIGAAKSLVHPIIILIMLIPMVVALAVWGGVGWVYWGSWTSAIQDLVREHVNYAWAANWDLAKLASWLAAGLALAVLAPIVILTALLIASVLAMPLLVRHVADRDYPHLARHHGGSVLGSLWNAAAAISLFVLLWVVTIPLWLLGPLAAPVPLLLSAYLNQRLFRYDALSDHANAAEMKQIFDLSRGRLLLLGLITGLLYFIPPLNLIAPIYAALAFIHLCLTELQAPRAGEGRTGDEGLRT